MIGILLASLKLGLRRPAQMFTAAVLSKLLTAGFSFAPREHLKSRKQVVKVRQLEPATLLPWEWMNSICTLPLSMSAPQVATLSVIFCVSVVTGNISLRFISVSFNQAVRGNSCETCRLLNVARPHQRVGLSCAPSAGWRYDTVIHSTVVSAHPAEA